MIVFVSKYLRRFKILICFHFLLCDCIFRFLLLLYIYIYMCIFIFIFFYSMILLVQREFSDKMASCWSPPFFLRAPGPCNLVFRCVSF